jgi:ubiquinone/menaquinone biosynthesis C-methylase UbiE
MFKQDDLLRLRAEYARREKALSESDRYSLFNPAYMFVIQQRKRQVLRLLKRYGFDQMGGKRILEVGCGEGGVLLEYLSFGADSKKIYGIDLLEAHASRAKNRLANANIFCADGQELPFSNDSFDLVVQYTAFSSLLDSHIKQQLSEEMLRVTRSDNGLILWYDFWINPRNPQTHGIRRGEIRRLFPNCNLEFQSATLAPPLCRRLVPISWILCEVLEKMRFLNTHHLVAIQRKRE